ncbi:hypothetical protein MYP_3178 [Sporocytophaga myxococcoides]|uniref:Uncharacterized protein n=1 Tax=Sporocytophaga myxococcoides TaxID=153721 RepID=A0A098LHM7_9BACT|nr:hypothetical protein [Sporocytophaga myxococcoides]GAL85949.1 hypothetical protein MYP_3178 [Sporocytophaga myxococcoides]
MESKKGSSKAGASGENVVSESGVARKKGEIFIDKAIGDPSSEVEGEEIESWGVYLQGNDRTILGLFYNRDLADIFLNSIKDSDVLKNIEKSGI